MGLTGTSINHQYVIMTIVGLMIDLQSRWVLLGDHYRKKIRWMMVNHVTLCLVTFSNDSLYCLVMLVLPGEFITVFDGHSHIALAIIVIIIVIAVIAVAIIVVIMVVVIFCTLIVFFIVDVLGLF